MFVERLLQVVIGGLTIITIILFVLMALGAFR